MTAVSGRRWAVVAAASGTVLIGGGAFWLSFTALADLAVRSGIDAGLAWIWPLLVDGLLVVATVAAVALDGHRSAWYPWALLIAGAGMSVTANAAHAIVAATASVPALLAAVVAAVPPLVLLASTHLTVVLTRSTKTRAIKSPAGLPVTGPARRHREHGPDGARRSRAQPPKLPEHPEPAATSEPETQPPALPEPQNKLQDEPTPKPSSGPDPTEPAPPKSGSPGRSRWAPDWFGVSGP